MNQKSPRSFRWAVAHITALFLSVALLVGVLWLPEAGRFQNEIVSARMQNARTIGLLLFQYSVDHNGHYPECRSSTEVFQQLLDGHYINNADIFYERLPGKVRAEGTQLKPENVAWDVTCCIDSSAPEGLPIVFLTGYKVDYKPGGKAFPFGPFPPRTLWHWLIGEREVPHMAVCYKGSSAQLFQLEKDGTVDNFIPSDFNPAGKTYRQLTP